LNRVKAVSSNYLQEAKMAPFYQKPENALKRADELVAVSQHSSALALLHEIIISKRARTTPLATLEPIVVKFLELCVLLMKGKMVREGLFAYKNIAQNTNISTIEVGVDYPYILT
jgi:translation initiation factor 3 subunit A